MVYQPTPRFPNSRPIPNMQAKLASAYNTVDDVDAYLGILVETHQSNALVGPTLIAILKEQFQRLRDGDRFWYEAYLDPATLSVVQHTKLSDIILRNSQPLAGSCNQTSLLFHRLQYRRLRLRDLPGPRGRRQRRLQAANADHDAVTNADSDAVTNADSDAVIDRNFNALILTPPLELRLAGEAHQSGLLSRELSPGSRRCQSASQTESCCGEPCVATPHRNLSQASSGPTNGR